jgi:integrase
MAQSGHIYLQCGKWYVRLRMNFLENAKIVRKQKAIFLAEKSGRYRQESDLAELAQEKLAGVKAAEKCPQSAELFVEYVEHTWLPFVARSKKPSTAAGYRSYWLGYIKPRVEGLALRDFDVAVISSLLEDAAEMHALNVDTVGKVRSILSAIFTYAIGHGHFPARSMQDNPAHSALIPETATEPEATHTATRAQVKASLAALDVAGLLLERAAVAIVAYTGVRPGEARGLQWPDWNRSADEIHVQRSIWHTHETTPKTAQSNAFVTVCPDLRAILLDLWESQGRPLGGYVLAHKDKIDRCGKPIKGQRANLDNLSKRTIVKAMSCCSVCQKSELAEHEDHDFKRDAKTSVPWYGFYSLRRFHGTEVRREAGNSDTSSKALRNSKAVADRHYLAPASVLPDVRRAVNGAMAGLSN